MFLKGGRGDGASLEGPGAGYGIALNRPKPVEPLLRHIESDGGTVEGVILEALELERRRGEGA